MHTKYIADACRGGDKPLTYDEWYRRRYQTGFVTLSRHRPSVPTRWSRTFDVWRSNLNGRPPPIALALAQDDRPFYSVYPDLDGVCDILEDCVDRLKQNQNMRFAINLESEQVSIQWSLRNRFQHMLSLGSSNFKVDRVSLPSSPTRDAWEVLLYGSPHVEHLYLNMDPPLPLAFLAYCDYMQTVGEPRVGHDDDGRVFRYTRKIHMSDPQCRGMAERVATLPQNEMAIRFAMVNTKVEAGWFAPRENEAAAESEVLVPPAVMTSSGLDMHCSADDCSLCEQGTRSLARSSISG
jgi:hypothetical protein